MRILRASICVVALSILTACASSPSFTRASAEANVPPANYRADILSYLRTYLNDPTGVRGAAITEPALKPIGATERYWLCLRYNAKRSTGEYEGSKDRVVLFLGGKLDTMVLARGDQCAGATWQPFPELEKLSR